MASSAPRRPDPRAVDSVLRALELVEERMGEEIGAEDMARAACYSLFYFSRLFAEATRHAPYDYLMRRRVAEAAEEVVGGSRSLTDIALDRGFGVPDSFARAFRRCFGLLPSEARKRGSFPRAIARTRIERSYVEAMLEGAVSPPTRVALEGAALLGRWEGRDSPPPRAPRHAPQNAKPQGRTLFALREIDDAGAVLRSFVGWASPDPSLPAFPLSATRLPAGEGLRFALAPPGSLELGRAYAYRSWLPSRGVTRPPSIEIVETEAATGEPTALILPCDACG